MRVFPTMVLMLCVATSAEAASLLSGPTINPANGHTDYLLTADAWTASEAFAETLGGHLVTIDDALENAWVSDTFTANGTINRALWLGLDDAGNEGTWTWLRGAVVAYLGWDVGQPNSGLGNWEEDWAHLWGTTGYGGSRDKWNDYLDGSSLDGQAPLHGVVEVTIVPQPGVAVRLGLGLVSLSTMRR